MPEVVPLGLGQPGKVSRFSPVLLDHFDLADDVNQGYEDLKSGQNIRGLIIH